MHVLVPRMHLYRGPAGGGRDDDVANSGQDFSSFGINGLLDLLEVFDGQGIGGDNGGLDIQTVTVPPQPQFRDFHDVGQCPDGVGGGLCQVRVDSVEESLTDVLGSGDQKDEDRQGDDDPDHWVSPRQTKPDSDDTDDDCQ